MGDEAVRILLIDGSQAQLEAVLHEAGMGEVIRVTDASQGAELLQLDDPMGPPPAFDLVIVADSPPAVDAIGFCRHVKASHRCADLAVLLVTSKAEERDIEAAFAAGATDHVHQPIYRSEFLARVRSALAVRRAGSERSERERRVHKEISLAQRVQRDSLSRPVCTADIEIDAAYMPSQHLSGDMYHWCQIDESRYGIVLVDVMGHGMSSALISMAVHGVMQRLMAQGAAPAAALVELNRHVLEYKPYFLTALYLIIDIHKQTVTWANAGHPPGLVLNSDRSITRLTRTSRPLGLESNPVVEQREAEFGFPARMILYTDGLTDDPGRRSPYEAIDQLKVCLQTYGRLDTASFIAFTIMEREKILAAADDICLICVTLPGRVAREAKTLQGVALQR